MAKVHEYLTLIVARIDSKGKDNMQLSLYKFQQNKDFHNRINKLI